MDVPTRIYTLYDCNRSGVDTGELNATDDDARTAGRHHACRTNTIQSLSAGVVRSSVVLLGSTEASAESRTNLDDVAAGLGSDLQLNGDRIVDAESNLADDPELPVTGEFDESFPLFQPVGEGPPVDELVLRSEHRDAVDAGDVLGDVVVTGTVRTAEAEMARISG